MSHKAHIEVLAWHQPEDARSHTFLEAGAAHDLVQRMAAEQINSRKIRMFAPDSVYMAGRVGVISDSVQIILETLPPAEIGNCKFIPPATEHNPTIARVHVEPALLAAQRWDWSAEPVTA